ncbi:MAG: hypothetical protein M1825_000763 [Sarcosagium campestre]|nr:MAG: hypothetical protein M1825_000763 [Sarcosagium campestre]
MPAFKDEHVLVIAPGSHTTLAQLGLPESFTPARLRIPTRMFPGPEKGQWEPYLIRSKTKTKEKKQQVSSATAAQDSKPESAGDATDAKHEAQVNGNADVDMSDAKPVDDSAADEPDAVDSDSEYEEDFSSEEGAVYPLQGGRVADWSCFKAFLHHVRNILSPTLHSPILLVAEACWTRLDNEILTNFIFEKFQPPAFCLMDPALAICYAYGVATATVIDVGYEKTDITSVSDFIAHDVGRGIAVPDAGGDAMTKRLFELLEPQGWTINMCEQLKRSPICEILPKDVPLPSASPEGSVVAVNPAAASSTGATASGPGARESLGAQGIIPRGPGVNTEVGDDDQDADLKRVEDDEGVLDVATIVSSGKTSEFLAKKEKEKAERAAAKKGAADAAAAALAASRPLKLPNSKRQKNMFFYEERRPDGVSQGQSNENANPDTVSDEAKGSPEKIKTPEVEPKPETTAQTESQTAEDGPSTVTKDFAATTLDASKPALEANGQQTAHNPSVPADDDTVKNASSDSKNELQPEPSSAPVTEAAAAADAAQPVPSTDEAPLQPTAANPEEQAARRATEKAARREEKRRNRQVQFEDPDFARREIEVGIERFMAATGGILETIADAVHRTVLSVEEVGKRGELWDSLIIVGNGSRVRGFKEGLLTTLNSKFLISPSSATIFTSELPSNISTPLATGANTPLPQSLLQQQQQQQQQHAASTSSHVNPLLLAATTASSSHHLPLTNATPTTPHQQQQLHQQQHSSSHSSHGQTPTSIKTVKTPDYFPEWKDVGFEEAAFLGAQVAAKVVFVVDGGASKGFMSRAEYNESGPNAVRAVCL